MNRKLLEYVYKKYGRELYIYLYSLCKEQTLAEELVQETFAKAILSLSDEHPNFRAWLYKVGKNLYQNYRKKWGREEQYQEMPEIPYEAGILERYIQNEENQRLYQEILKLQEDQKQVIILFYFSECSIRETAEIMGLKEGHVRMLLTRARRKLKERLEEES